MCRRNGVLLHSKTLNIEIAYNKKQQSRLIKFLLKNSDRSLMVRKVAKMKSGWE